VFDQLFRVGKPAWEHLLHADGAHTWSWATALTRFNITLMCRAAAKNKFILTWCFKEYYDEGEQRFESFEAAETGAIEQLIMKLIPCLDLSPMTELPALHGPQTNYSR